MCNIQQRDSGKATKESIRDRALFYSLCTGVFWGVEDLVHLSSWRKKSFFFFVPSHHFFFSSMRFLLWNNSYRHQDELTFINTTRIQSLLIFSDKKTIVSDEQGSTTCIFYSHPQAVQSTSSNPAGNTSTNHHHHQHLPQELWHLCSKTQCCGSRKSLAMLEKKPNSLQSRGFDLHVSFSQSWLI